MKVSIVVPNFNYAKYLPACLDSIAAQTYQNIEVLLADGGSTDGSVEILESYSLQYGWKIFSRNDQGQVDALNRGLSLASGDIQGWLNSDDVLLSNRAVEIAVIKFQEISTVDIVSLGGYYIDANYHYLRPIKLHNHPLIRQTDLVLRYGGFVQPATFWRREVFTTLMLDPSLPYSFDSDFLLRALQKFNLMVDQDCYIAGYRLHNSNLSIGVKPERILELSRLNEKHLGQGSRTLYLKLVATLLEYINSFPQPLSCKISRSIYALNNLLSYLTVYRVPSM